jgi:hypothetical protein
MILLNWRKWEYHMSRRLIWRRLKNKRGEKTWFVSVKFIRDDILRDPNRSQNQEVIQCKKCHRITWANAPSVDERVHILYRCDRCKSFYLYTKKPYKIRRIL